MPATRTRGAFPIPASAILLSLFVFVAAATSIAYAATPKARVDKSSRVSVTSIAGHVEVTMAGAATAVQPESTVSLPARVVTGSDGTLGLTQAGTKITVAADSDVEIPAEAVDGNLIARLVQHRGNVFYDVAHRDLGKLRVETPFLVAVIKGTQFNVAVQDDSTTISLFEGRLEIGTPDGDDFIQLDAGEIAIRSSIDDSIRIVGMNEERVEAPRAAERPRDDAAAAAEQKPAQADQTPAPERVVAGDASATASTTTVAANTQGEPRTVEVSTDVANDVTVALERPTDVTLTKQPAVQIAASLDLEAGIVGVDTRDKIDLGVANTGLGGSASSSVADGRLSPTLDLGATNVAVGALTVVSLDKVDLGVSADTSLGGIATGVALGENLDRGNAGTGVPLDTRTELGGIVGVDLAADAGIGAGSANIAVDTGIGLGGTTVDVGLTTGVGQSGGTGSVAVDLGTVRIDLGVDTGGRPDLGIDLGAAPDIVAPVVAPIVAPIAPVVAPILPPGLGGVGGGLGGLLGRH